MLSTRNIFMVKSTVLWTNLSKKFKDFFPDGVRPKETEVKGARKVTAKSSGKVSVQGNPHLKQSEHYPPKFCMTFEFAFRRFYRNLHTCPTPEEYVIQKCGAPLVRGHVLLGKGSSDNAELEILGSKRKHSSIM